MRHCMRHVTHSGTAHTSSYAAGNALMLLFGANVLIGLVGVVEKGMSGWVREIKGDGERDWLGLGDERELVVLYDTTFVLH